MRVQKIAVTKAQKWLLIWSASAIVLAEIVKRVRFEEKTSIVIGLIEILLACLTGIALGLTTTRSSK